VELGCSAGQQIQPPRPGEQLHVAKAERGIVVDGTGIFAGPKKKVKAKDDHVSNGAADDTGTSGSRDVTDQTDRDGLHALWRVISPLVGAKLTA